ncbi:type II CAAX prenyl endopeptidase Rce1 family protein, partial [Streptomonospora algeriensis]
RERVAAAVLAVTAGVGEELLYRGLLVAFGVALGLPVWAAAAAACLLFALAHLYQGWWGVVGPGLLGALFMVVYLGTGSLLIPIAAHVVLELRSLLLTGSGRRHRARAL